MANHDITQDFLRSLFEYDPETGVLTWKWRPRELFSSDKGWRIANSKCAGKPTGCVSYSGYAQVNFFGKILPAHRLIWILIHGECPDEVDHINGVKHDNRLCNLRNVDHGDNTRNAGSRADNSSGTTGVYLRECGRKWRAQINSQGKRVDLGTYGSFEEAVKARASANERFGFHTNHGRTAK